MKSTSSKQTQNNCITFVQRRPNVVGPMLYKCYTNVLFSLGHWCLTLFQIIMSYCTFQKNNVPKLGQCTNILIPGNVVLVYCSAMPKKTISVYDRCVCTWPFSYFELCCANSRQQYLFTFSVSRYHDLSLYCVSGFCMPKH